MQHKRDKLVGVAYRCKRTKYRVQRATNRDAEGPNKDGNSEDDERIAQALLCD